jgi:SAM-dependent methyltransferase
MYQRPAEQFFRTSIEKILRDKKEILDIGGALRIDGTRGNKVNPENAWIKEEIQKREISYKVLDYVDTFHPDIVGDIQDLSLPSDSVESMVCLSILEHVPNPFLSAKEMFRVLKPGGYCFVYVPFLFYYHAEHGYYADYWRFTKDSLKMLFEPFSTFDLQSARGPIETLVRLSPLGRHTFFCDIGHLFDRAAHKLGSSQTSGYYLFLIK